MCIRDRPAAKQSADKETAAAVPKEYPDRVRDEDWWERLLREVKAQHRATYGHLNAAHGHALEGNRLVLTYYPVSYTHLSHAGLRFELNPWVQLALATPVQFFSGWPFYRGAYRLSLIHI